MRSIHGTNRLLLACALALAVLVPGCKAKTKPPAPQAVETFARSLAEPRRAAYVDSMLKKELAPVWDDTAKARLARGYAALDPRHK